MSLLRKGVRETPEENKFRYIRGNLLKKLEISIAERNLFHRGSSIIAAVSGGADSVCMLHLLAKLIEKTGIRLHVAHYDHCLRGSESGRDAEFTKKLAGSMGLPFSLGCGDVRDFANRKKMSIQEAARLLRYDFLENIRTDNGADLIATAHTADDQAEEVLSRLIRGSGLQGLAGIPWKRGNTVIRPMLGIGRQEISLFLERHSISHVEDSSNFKRKYLRNRIRLDLIPFLQDCFNPAVVSSLNRTAKLLADDNEVLDAIATDAFRDCEYKSQRADDHGSLVFKIQALLAFHAAIRRRIYRRALKMLGVFNGSITAVHLFAIDQMVRENNPSAVIALPHGTAAARNYSSLIISADGITRSKYLSGKGNTFDILLKGPGIFELPGECGTLVLQETDIDKERLKTGGDFPRVLFLGMDKIRFPLRSRFRRHGDHFHPFGWKHECRLKNFLINRKIPRHLRDSIPLLVMDDIIIAVGGVEVAESAVVNAKAKKYLIFKWTTAISGTD